MYSQGSNLILFECLNTAFSCRFEFSGRISDTDMNQEAENDQPIKTASGMTIQALKRTNDTFNTCCVRENNRYDYNSFNASMRCPPWEIYLTESRATRYCPPGNICEQLGIPCDPRYCSKDQPLSNETFVHKSTVPSSDTAHYTIEVAAGEKAVVDLAAPGKY